MKDLRYVQHSIIANYQFKESIYYYFIEFTLIIKQFSLIIIDIDCYDLPPKEVNM